MGLIGAVISVSDLDRSKQFYGELLDLDVRSHVDDALVLFAEDGSHLILRARNRGVHPSGVLGVQHLIWRVASREDMARAERVFDAWRAHVTTRNEQGLTAVEGHDPDRVPISVTYACADGVVSSQFLTRAFAF
jgi:catechol 2,3-dioxygenase-like lactoylglutathione lyase family enzyme